MMCQDILDRCPKHKELVFKECKPVLDWDGQGTPPMCPEACMNITRAPSNAKRLACCDCGKGAPGMMCRIARMKFEAACGISDIECDGTSDSVGCVSAYKHIGAI